MRWTCPARWAGSPMWDDLYPTFIWNLLTHLNQKVCYVAGKRSFWSRIFEAVSCLRAFFTINSDGKLCETNYGKNSAHSYRENILILFD